MKTLSAVESFTGGLFSKIITDKPGASKFFKGSLVTYCNETKETLGIDSSNGVYNEKIALEMAIKGKTYFKTDICVSFTGVAGPNDHKDIKVGTVFIGINEEVFSYNLEGTRDDVRKQSVKIAWDKIKHEFQ